MIMEPPLPHRRLSKFVSSYKYLESDKAPLYFNIQREIAHVVNTNEMEKS